jgi:hypothetical protein
MKETLPRDASGMREPHSEPASPHQPGVVYFLVSFLGAGLLLRLLAAWTSVPALVEKTLPDDAFYYFTIARNVCSGNGISVDGLVPTNGFHPLWALMLLPIYVIFHTGDLPIHIALTLAAVLDLGTAWLSYASVRRLTGSAHAGVLSALLIALNPSVAMESLNGLETALSLFCAALTFYVYVRFVADAEKATTRGWALFGGAVGLMLLARTDNILMAACMGLHALWTRRHLRGLRHTLRSTMTGLALAAAVSALFLSPWLIWNQLTFGSIVQSSATAAPAVFRRALLQPLTAGVPFTEVWRQGLWPVVYLALLLAFRYAGVAWTAVFVSTLLQRIINRRWPTAGERFRQTTPLLAPFVAALLLLIVHTFVRWYPRSWYFVMLAWASALAAGPVLAGAAHSLNSSRVGRLAVRIGAACIVLLLALQAVKGWRAGFYPWQSHMLAGARWMAAETAPNAVVASFNSGLQAYYGERQIVNLDGVVNWEAVKAMEDRSLLAYAARRGVTYLVDYEAYIFGQYGPYLGANATACLEETAQISPAYPPYGAVKAYILRPDCVE